MQARVRISNVTAAAVLMLMFFAMSCYAGDPVYLLPRETRMVYMYCEDSSGYRLQNCNVIGSISPVLHTGGHIHEGDPRYGNPRNSSLSPSSGNTGSVGYVSTYISATRIGQTEIVHVCAAGGTCTDTQVYVRRPGLVQLGPNEAYQNYVLVGSTASHPANHYFTQSTKDAVLAIIAEYNNQYSTYPGYQAPAINDSALATGGYLTSARQIRTVRFPIKIRTGAPIPGEDRTSRRLMITAML